MKLRKVYLKFCPLVSLVEYLRITGARTNTELMTEKLQMPILAVGGDFFFGEVPRRQMEKVRGVQCHLHHC